MRALWRPEGTSFYSNCNLVETRLGSCDSDFEKRAPSALRRLVNPRIADATFDCFSTAEYLYARLGRVGPVLAPCSYPILPGSSTSRHRATAALVNKEGFGLEGLYNLSAERLYLQPRKWKNLSGILGIQHRSLPLV